MAGEYKGGGGEIDEGRLGEFPVEVGRDADGGEDEADGVLGLGEALAEACGERPFAGGAVGFDVAQVVHGEDGDGEEAGRDGRGDDGVGEISCHEVVRAADGDGAEEREREEFAPAVVAEGIRSAGVGEGADDRCDADVEVDDTAAVEDV
jgi:hypothetical protein